MNYMELQQCVAGWRGLHKNMDVLDALRQSLNLLVRSPSRLRLFFSKEANVDFSPLIILLALSNTFETWDQAAISRARFPPDEVLNNWMSFNRARCSYLKTKSKELQHKSLYWEPRYTDEELQWISDLRIMQEETDQLYQICFYISALPSQRGPTPWELVAWMDSARRRCTDEEWYTGYIPWGAVPPE